MALAAYILSLAGSGGIAGIVARQLLGGQGYVLGFRMGLLAAGGCAALYITLQLAWMLLLRILKPTSSSAPLWCEVLSHSAILAFAPFLLHIPIPWPHPVLAKVALPIFAGVFAAGHGFFKLASFYGAIKGKPSGRLGSVGWLLGVCAASAAAYVMIMGWITEIQQVRPQAPDKVEVHRIGDAYAAAREVPEGAEVNFEYEYAPNLCLTLRWAAPDAPHAEDAEPLEQIYITALFNKSGTSAQTTAVPLSSSGWADLCITNDRIPPKSTSCRILWESKKAPSWRKFVPLRPVVRSDLKMLLSGPIVHEQRPVKEDGAGSDPNILIIAVEGLAANHVSGMGYKRNTTTALDRLAQSAQTFPNAYTPAPDAAAACVTLLTGLNPLRHGFLGMHCGPLAKQYETLTTILARRHYTTAAFTEGEGEDGKDLLFGNGFERGFEIFDPSYRASAEKPEELVASAATLAKIGNWLETNANRKYFVFARLRELRNPQWSDRYAPGFVANPAAPIPVDVYDSALVYLDRRIGELIKQARAGKNTCIVVTSTYGFDFAAYAAGLSALGLSEGSLRVPLFILTPGVEKTERTSVVALEDLAPTLMTLAHTGLDYLTDGKELLQNPANRSPISMFGNPLSLSIRVDRWRFTWQSGRTAFSTVTPISESTIELVDIVDARKRGYPVNAMTKHPDFVTRYRARLDEFLNANMK